jgi:hypothetical protein
MAVSGERPVTQSHGDEPRKTETFYGTKKVEAWDEERNGVPGKGIRYEDGYESWTPLEAFKAYQPITGMSFGHALVALKERLPVSREGWNEKDAWIILVEAETDDYEVKPWVMFDCWHLRDFIAMGTVDKQFVPWVASQTDMLANDWYIKELD